MFYHDAVCVCRKDELNSSAAKTARKAKGISSSAIIVCSGFLFFLRLQFLFALCSFTVSLGKIQRAPADSLWGRLGKKRD